MDKIKRQPKKSIRFFNDREVRAVWDSIQLVSDTHGLKINDREMFMKEIDYSYYEQMIDCYREREKFMI